KNKISDIEKQLGKKFKFTEVPSGKEICTKQLFHLIDRMEKVTVDHTQIDSFLPEITKKLEWLDREELIKKFVSLEFNRFLDYYKNLPDLGKPDKKDRSKRREQFDGDMTRFFINLGKKDNLKPTDIIGIIKDNLSFKEIGIGDIDIKETFSFFEIESDYQEELLKNVNTKNFRSRKISLEVASKRKNDRQSSGSRNRNPRNENRFSKRKKSGKDSESQFKPAKRKLRRKK
ncbi:MAG: DbpA RNA binding domain-containing protein, partial [Ignavibacteriae bacterium]|nr:DbpA RNA binding domain-containing protein [Ignavibacteriota bacterium]